jgi:hypothetical protein
MTESDHRARDPGVTETTDDARQGVTGHNVRNVLAFGLGGAIIVVVGAAFVFMALN